MSDLLFNHVVPASASYNPPLEYTVLLSEENVDDALHEFPALLHDAAGEFRTVGLAAGESTEVFEISWVAPNSPAAKLGMMAGDQLVSINSTPVTEVGRLLVALERIASEPGAVVEMIRDTRRITLSYEFDRSALRGASVARRAD